MVNIILETAVDRLFLSYGNDMQEHRVKPLFTEWMRPGMVCQFLQNLGIQCGVIVLVKGMTINGERCLAWRGDLPQIHVQWRFPG